MTSLSLTFPAPSTREARRYIHPPNSAQILAEERNKDDKQLKKIRKEGNRIEPSRLHGLRYVEGTNCTRMMIDHRYLASEQINEYLRSSTYPQLNETTCSVSLGNDILSYIGSFLTPNEYAITLQRTRTAVFTWSRFVQSRYPANGYTPISYQAYRQNQLFLGATKRECPISSSSSYLPRGRISPYEMVYQICDNDAFLTWKKHSNDLISMPPLPRIPHTGFSRHYGLNERSLLFLLQLYKIDPRFKYQLTFDTVVRIISGGNLSMIRKLTENQITVEVGDYKSENYLRSLTCTAITLEPRVREVYRVAEKLRARYSPSMNGISSATFHCMFENTFWEHGVSQSKRDMWSASFHHSKWGTCSQNRNDPFFIAVDEDEQENLTRIEKLHIKRKEKNKTNKKKKRKREEEEEN